jgi:uncharacterized membrane protein
MGIRAVRAARGTEVVAMAGQKPTRLFLMAFTDSGIPPYVLQLIKEAAKDKQLVISDWAMIQHDAGTEPKITTDQAVDPGAGRGAGFGGLAGLVLAGIAGPIGVGAVAAGAAIGAVTAGLKDSGLKDGDLKAISGLMAEGRSGLIVAVPLENADAFEAFTKHHVEFESVIRRVQVDITPGHSLAQAIEEYKAHQQDRQAQPVAD